MNDIHNDQGDCDVSWEDDCVPLLSGQEDENENLFNLESNLEAQEIEARHDSQEDQEPVVEYLCPLVAERCSTVTTKQPPSLHVLLTTQGKDKWLNGYWSHSQFFAAGSCEILGVICIGVESRPLSHVWRWFSDQN